MVRRYIPFVFDLWKHRELLLQFTLRNVETRHKGSHLGLLWAVLNPLLSLALYVFIFGYVLGGSFKVIPGETKVDYSLAIFVGMSLFRLVAESIGGAPGVIASNPNFVKKVVFPLELLPAAMLGEAFIHFAISLALALLGIAVFGPGLTAGAFWLPVIFLPVLMLGLGIAWLFSALGVFFRDLAQVTQSVTMALMFSSAVFYPVSAIPGPAWEILKFNPLIHAIELSRNAALWNLPVSLSSLAFLYGSGFVACFAGYAVFRRLRPAFADVL